MGVIALTLWCVSMACGCASSRAPESSISPADPVYARIETANEQLMERMRAGDRAGVAAMYADDAMLLSAGGARLQGRSAVDEYWSGGGPADWRLEILSLEGDERLVVQRGRSTLTNPDTDRPPSVVDFVVVWTLDEDGEYRIAVDAWW